MAVELPYSIPCGATLGERVRYHRRRLGLTQVELAGRARINQGFLSEIERNQRRPSADTLNALASALDMPVPVLIGVGREHDSPQPLLARVVPLYGSIPAGPPAASQEQPDSYPVLSHLWTADRYCLRLTFDSMEPTLKPGDIILVHYRVGVAPEHVQGRVCACLVDRQPTLKRVTVEDCEEGRRIILRGDNPRVAPIVIDEHVDFSIQGVVVALVSRDL